MTAGDMFLAIAVVLGVLALLVIAGIVALMRQAMRHAPRAGFGSDDDRGAE